MFWLWNVWEHNICVYRDMYHKHNNFNITSIRVNVPELVIWYSYRFCDSLLSYLFAGNWYNVSFTGIMKQG